MIGDYHSIGKINADLLQEMQINSKNNILCLFSKSIKILPQIKFITSLYL